MRDGAYHEVPLSEAHHYTRQGCMSCPDFSAEHADISTGGIGAFADYTLTLARTETGRDILAKLSDAGLIETRPASDDPGAVQLLNKLSRVSRRRWPEGADPIPGVLPPPKS
jgi:coenzyme F420 hydrogenase subunit beta